MGRLGLEPRGHGLACSEPAADCGRTETYRATESEERDTLRLTPAMHGECCDVEKMGKFRNAERGFRIAEPVS
jgi:hypothetical protein